MTVEEIESERSSCRVAITSPGHPYSKGVHLFLKVYTMTDEDTKAFMRKIAPYMFEKDGVTLIS